MNQPDQGERLVRAACTAETITVYQAYFPQIAEAAIRAGTFVPPFSRDRMTWIKPSFGWMLHRSGWASKPGHERVLAIEITRAGFDWALAHSCLSHYDSAQHDSAQDWTALKEASPVRVQWDPDRSLTGERLARRAIQIGLSGEAVHRYCDQWITAIADLTATVHKARQLLSAGQIAEAIAGLPAEHVYPLSPELARAIDADAGHLAREKGAR